MALLVLDCGVMNHDFPAGGEMPKTLLARWAGKLEALGVSPKKAGEYVGLFVVLGIIYYGYFVRDARPSTCSPDVEISLSQLGMLMLKFFAFTAWPFALMAGLDRTWRSKDAGNVFLVAYVMANVLWYRKTGCGFCVYAAAFRIIPFVFCAMIAHGLGAWRHRLRGEE